MDYHDEKVDYYVCIFRRKCIHNQYRMKYFHSFTIFYNKIFMFAEIFKIWLV